MVTDTHGTRVCPGVICTLLSLQWTHSGDDKAHYHDYLLGVAVDHTGASMQARMPGLFLSMAHEKVPD